MEWILDLIGGGLGVIGAVASAPFLIGMGVIGYVLATLTSIFVSLTGWLTDVMIGLQSLILTKNPIVDVGWSIVRDVANLGFVLAIIIIALATILRLEEYGVKKLLPRLIAAAILVNFSFAIARLFIDFSQTLTNFFFSKITGAGVTGIAFNLFGAFGPQRFWQGINFDNIASALGSLTAGAVAAIGGPWLIALFNLIMIFVMLVFAFMLFLRYLWLSFLVIISPIVWLFWVIPGLAGQFSKWWSKFLEWVFFAPVVSFFLYLAFISASKLQDFPHEAPKEVGGIATYLQTMFEAGIEVIILSGIMIGGLIVAQSMGITGAAGAVGLLQKGGQAVKGWAQAKALRGGAQMVGSLGGLAQKWTQGQPKTMFGKAMYAITGGKQGAKVFGQALYGLSDISQQHLVKDASKRQEKYSEEYGAKRFKDMAPYEQVAWIERATKNKTLKLIPNLDGYIKDQEFEDMFKRYGKGKSYDDMLVGRGANRQILTAENQENRELAAVKWYGSLSPEDRAKLPFNELYTDYDPSKPQLASNKKDHFNIQQVITIAMGIKDPGDMRKVFSKLKSNNLIVAEAAVNKAVDRLRVIGSPKAADNLEEVRDDSLAKRLMGLETPPAGAAAGTTP